MIKQAIQDELLKRRMTKWCLANEVRDTPGLSYHTVLRFLKDQQDMSCSRVELLLDHLNLKILPGGQCEISE